MLGTLTRDDLVEHYKLRAQVRVWLKARNEGLLARDKDTVMYAIEQIMTLCDPMTTRMHQDLKPSARHMGDRYLQIVLDEWSAHDDFICGSNLKFADDVEIVGFHKDNTPKKELNRFLAQPWKGSKMEGLTHMFEGMRMREDALDKALVTRSGQTIGVAADDVHRMGLKIRDGIEKHVLGPASALGDRYILVVLQQWIEEALDSLVYGIDILEDLVFEED